MMSRLSALLLWPVLATSASAQDATPAGRVPTVIVREGDDARLFIPGGVDPVQRRIFPRTPLPTDHNPSPQKPPRPVPERCAVDLESRLA